MRAMEARAWGDVHALLALPRKRMPRCLTQFDLFCQLGGSDISDGKDDVLQCMLFKAVWSRLERCVGSAAVLCLLAARASGSVCRGIALPPRRV